LVGSQGKRLRVFHGEAIEQKAVHRAGDVAGEPGRLEILVQSLGAGGEPGGAVSGGVAVNMEYVSVGDAVAKVAAELREARLDPVFAAGGGEVAGRKGQCCYRKRA